ncbi:Ribosomal protein L24e domain containing protein [Elaphomyces granulatus]|jgi:large subunit ribosomal protein L24e
MRIDPCSFCGRPTYIKGITFVRNDAKCFRFCRSKCHKNFKAKRLPRKVRWTQAHRTKAGKQMIVDSTVQFAASRRNVPVRYNRELVSQTVRAMGRISEIRARRERAFYKKRISGKRAQEVIENRKLVAQSEHLLPRLREKEMRAFDTGDSVVLRAKQKSKVFGTERKKLRARIDGSVEEVSQQTDGFNDIDMG